MAISSQKRGRKPLHPGGSDTVALRIPRELIDRIDRLAEARGRTRSEEARHAFRFWTGFHRQDVRHIGQLLALIELLIRDIEKRTGKQWLDDAATGVYVAKLVEELIFHLAPTPPERVTIPPEIREILSLLIIRYENQLYVTYEDRAKVDDRIFELETILRDLGSGFQRNRKIWLKGTGAKP
jgi:predicted transcriptional regulator